MSPHLKIKVELPPCGMLVGTGIMNSKAGYLVGTGKTHTTWVPQLFTPLAAGAGLGKSEKSGGPGLDQSG